MALLDPLADRGNPVPPAIPVREGREIQELEGRPACLIKFLPGVSVTHPTPAQARAAGAALAHLHRSLADFTLERHTGLGPDDWPRLMRRCGDDIDSSPPGRECRLHTALDDVPGHRPAGLASSAIHPEPVQ